MSKLKEGYIRYSNEEQRKTAIMQAESLGYEEWPKNRKYQKPSDNCIVFRGIDGEWNDELCTEITEADFYEIPLDAKEYDKALESNQYSTMNPNGHDFEATKDVPLITVPTVATFFNIDPDKYTKTESEDGTITLKPKKKIKVWITTWLNEYRDIEVLKSFDKNHYTLLLDSKQKMNWTLLETIEREYEI